MLVWSCPLVNSTSALVIADEIWGMIKTTALYQLSGYKTLELVAESELISNSNYYDPTNIPESSNSVMAKE
jgi:hypothetical protein